MPLATDSDVERVYHSLQAANTRRTRQAIALAWLSTFNVRDIDASSAALAPILAEIIGAAQVSAVNTGLAYYSTRVRDAVLSEDFSYTVAPRAFAGISQDGLAVGAAGSTLARVVSKGAVGQGMSPTLAGQTALRRVTEFAETETHDAGTAVVDLQAQLDPRVIGYERTLSGGPCGRCIILGGKFFRKETEFDRHDRDACGMSPVFAGEDRFTTAQTNPNILLAQLDDDGRRKALGGQANLDAYNAGVDPSSLINARSGMRKAGDPFTTSGVTSRSLFAAVNRADGVSKQPGQRYKVSTRARLSPAGCRQAAAGDPVKYKSLLLRNAYIY